MRGWLPLITVLGAAALSATIASCLDPTEIVLELSTNAPCSDVATNGATIRIGTPNTVDTENAQSFDVRSCNGDANGGTLGTLVLLPHDSVDENVAVTVTLGTTTTTTSCLPTTANPSPDQTQCIVAKRQLGYVSHRKLLLPIELDTACAGVSCQAPLTCIGGHCAGEGVDCDGGTCKPGIIPDAAVDVTGIDVSLDIGVLDSPSLDACVKCPNTSNTSCVDFTKDPTNCGACGVDCTGGQCVNGTCMLAPATSLGGSTCLTVFGGYVYVTRASSPTGVFRVPTNGGSVASALTTSAQGIANNGLDVYFGESPGTTWSLGSIKSGTTAVTSAINALSVNTSVAAWFDFAKGYGYEAAFSSLINATPFVTTCSPGSDASVIVSAKYVHATCAGSSAQVCAHSIGGSTTCLTPNGYPSLSNPRGVAVDNLTSIAPVVYFTNAGTDIWKADTSVSATSITIVATGAVGLHGLVDDAGMLYAIGQQSIVKTAGATFTPVASVTAPSSQCLAVDQNAVYWIDATGLYKHAK